MNQASRTIAALLVVTLALPAYAEITDDVIKAYDEEFRKISK